MERKFIKVGVVNVEKTANGYIKRQSTTPELLEDGTYTTPNVLTTMLTFETLLGWGWTADEVKGIITDYETNGLDGDTPQITNPGGVNG